MNYGPFAKAVGHTLDTTFDAVQRAAPHVIAAHKVIVGKVLFPAGTYALSGVATLAAKVLSPKRSAG